MCDTARALPVSLRPAARGLGALTVTPYLLSRTCDAGASTKSLLRLYVLPLLMRAAAVPRRQAGGDDDTTPSSRREEAGGGGDGTPPAPWREEEEEDASVLLRAGLEALRGLVSLLNTWQQAKVPTHPLTAWSCLSP